MQTTSTLFFSSFFVEIDISNVELKERSVVQDPVVYPKLTSSKCSRFSLLSIYSCVISVPDVVPLSNLPWKAFFPIFFLIMLLRILKVNLNVFNNENERSGDFHHLYIFQNLEVERRWGLTLYILPFCKSMGRGSLHHEKWSSNVLHPWLLALVNIWKTRQASFSLAAFLLLRYSPGRPHTVFSPTSLDVINHSTALLATCGHYQHLFWQ